MADTTFHVLLKPTAQLILLRDENGQQMQCRLWQGVNHQLKTVRAYIAAIWFEAKDDSDIVRYLKAIELAEEEENDNANGTSC
jgi:hypothetical protein